MSRRVVITGVGPVSPIGLGATDFWNALVEGRSGIRLLRSFDPAEFPSRIGGEIDGLSVGDAVPKGYRKAAKIMARDIVLAVVAAYHAVRDAGLNTKCLVERGEAAGPPNVDSTRFGANIGAGLICADLPELAEALHGSSRDGVFDIAAWGAEGMNNLTPLWLLKFLPNMLACHVTIVHDAQGPSNTITCGEASAHLAIGEAFRTIARGTAEVVICGGAESKTNPMALIRQCLSNWVSRDNDHPERACKPFSARRDGSAISEGGGLVILEELEHARRRNARIYAELVGFGAAYDAQTAAFPTPPHDDGRGVQWAMRKALADARLDPGQVDLVGSAACGLSRDKVEAAGIAAVLGSRASEVPVLNVRGGLGNNGAGSGALDFIATVQALHNGTLPPAINSAPVDAACPVKLALQGPTDLLARTAVSLAWAVNRGQHAALVLQRWLDSPEGAKR